MTHKNVCVPLIHLFVWRWGSKIALMLGEHEHKLHQIPLRVWPPSNLSWLGKCKKNFLEVYSQHEIGGKSIFTRISMCWEVVHIFVLMLNFNVHAHCIRMLFSCQISMWCRLHSNVVAKNITNRSWRELIFEEGADLVLEEG